MMILLNWWRKLLLRRIQNMRWSACTVLTRRECQSNLTYLRFVLLVLRLLICDKNEANNVIINNIWFASLSCLLLLIGMNVYALRSWDGLQWPQPASSCAGLLPYLLVIFHSCCVFSLLLVVNIPLLQRHSWKLILHYQKFSGCWKTLMAGLILNSRRCILSDEQFDCMMLIK